MTNPVTVAPAPPQVFASDQFARTIAAGWGTADQGGSWTLSGSTGNFSVDGSVGKIKMASPAAGPSAYLNGVSARDVDAVVDVSLDKPATGGGVYLSLGARQMGASMYQLQTRVQSNGSVSVSLMKVFDDAETVLTTQTVSGLTVLPGDVIRMRLSVTGTGTTALTGKVWKVGGTEPGWQINATNADAALQGPGAVRLKTYLSGSANNAPVTAAMDNFMVQAAG